MMLRCKKEWIDRQRVAFLFLVLTGIGVFQFTHLWATPAFQHDIRNQGRLLAQLSFTDAAVAQVEKRFSTYSSKPYKQNLTPGLPLAKQTLKVMEFGDRERSAVYMGQAYSIVCLSPPSDRAPPFA